MKREPTGRLAWLLLICASVGVFFAGRAHAGETVTVQSITYELRNELSKPISKGYKTAEECMAAAPVPSIGYLCIARVVFDKVGFCDVAPPPPAVVDPEGFTLLGDYVPHECPNDHVYFTQVQQVRDPYPSCAWVEKPVQYTDCNGELLKKIDPDADNGTAQTDQTPGPWIEGVDYPLDTPCPEEAHGNCALSPRAPA